MDENKERAKGAMDDLAGNVKQGIGNLTGNDRMVGEGKAQEAEGDIRQGVAKGVGQVKGAAEEVGGKIKQAFGDATDDTSTQASGAADELRGEARQKLNQ